MRADWLPVARADGRAVGVADDPADNAPADDGRTDVRQPNFVTDGSADGYADATAHGTGLLDRARRDGQWVCRRCRTWHRATRPSTPYADAAAHGTGLLDQAPNLPTAAPTIADCTHSNVSTTNASYQDNVKLYIKSGFGSGYYVITNDDAPIGNAPPPFAHGAHHFMDDPRHGREARRPPFLDGQFGAKNGRWRFIDVGLSRWWADGDGPWGLPESLDWLAAAAEPELLALASNFTAAPTTVGTIAPTAVPSPSFSSSGRNVVSGIVLFVLAAPLLL